MRSLMNLLQDLKCRAAGSRGVSVRHAAIYERFRDYTMMPRRNYVENLKLTELAAAIPGCVVECGVWRGGAIAGMAELLGPGRTYYLFDSFEGLPPAREIDGEAALDWQRDTESPYFFDNCRTDMEWARRAMRLSGAERVEFVKGWFAETLPSFSPGEGIAVLRLDADWYDSTLQALIHLYPRVARGGITIIDDYYVWDGCARAVHDYLSHQQLPDRIREAYSSGCYLIKS